jgi:hypothetical protein
MGGHAGLGGERLPRRHADRPLSARCGHHWLRIEHWIAAQRAIADADLLASRISDKPRRDGDGRGNAGCDGAGRRRHSDHAPGGRDHNAGSGHGNTSGRDRNSTCRHGAGGRSDGNCGRTGGNVYRRDSTERVADAGGRTGADDTVSRTGGNGVAGPSRDLRSGGNSNYWTAGDGGNVSGSSDRDAGASSGKRDAWTKRHKSDAERLSRRRWWWPDRHVNANANCHGNANRDGNGDAISHRYPGSDTDEHPSSGSCGSDHHTWVGRRFLE